MKTIIVGGVAGGMSAATRLRRLNEDAEIIILEKGPHVSFANCGLPYYIGGEIQDKNQLLVQTPEKLKDRFNLDVRVNSEAVKIDGDNKQVTIEHDGETYQECYDYLILSPGASPIIPPMDNIDKVDNMFTLRNVPDLEKIMDYLENHQVEEAVVVGAGFIGLEMVENLARLSIKTTVVELAPHILPPLDQEMAAFIHNELEANGVTVLTQTGATGFSEDGKTVYLDNGQELATDLTILSVGVRPESKLAADAGVELGMRNGILVDENYETNVSGIYAVGDAIIVKQQITGDDTMIALASPANRQGRQVADIISGLNRKNRGSIGTSIVRVFDKVAASTGLSERIARQNYDDIVVVHSLSQSHASYYPGSKPIHMKLVFRQDEGQILGAQAVGSDGVDKRIDILATAIKGGLTVEDLPELELTYAPPFGSAKDAVNMLGYVALNVYEGLSEGIQWHEVDQAVQDGAVIIDTRSPEEVEAGRMKYDNILYCPINDLRDQMDKLDKNVQYILLCQSGTRSYYGERILKQAGYQAKNIDGGFALYSNVLKEEIR